MIYPFECGKMGKDRECWHHYDLSLIRKLFWTNPSTPRRFESCLSQNCHRRVDRKSESLSNQPLNRQIVGCWQVVYNENTDVIRQVQALHLSWFYSPIHICRSSCRSSITSTKVVNIDDILPGYQHMSSILTSSMIWTFYMICTVMPTYGSL